MSLAKIQFFSLFTKGVTRALGIAQTLVVVNVLTKEEWGLVGLVMAVGGAIGVSQHLGIVDGAIREIAVRTNKKEIGKVFWVSQFTRQLVTIPLSIALFLLAEPIAANIYHRPEIVPYLHIFAIVLILQGLQDVLGAAITGLKEFFSLYIIQIITAALNVVIFGLFSWQFGITGFFWAVVLTTFIMVVLYGFSIAKHLLGHLQLPSWPEVKMYSKRLLHISAYMYLARIFFVLWQRMPTLILAGVLTDERLGDLAIAFTFGSQLTIISMAISEVNISWMSSIFVKQRDLFIRQVIRNMKRVFYFLLLITITMLFFIPEIIYFFGTEYLAAYKLIILIIAAFFLYSLLDIGTSSVFVPGDKPQKRALVFGVLIAVSAALTSWSLFTAPSALFAAAALLIGAVVAYLLMVALVWYQFKIALLTGRIMGLMLLFAASLAWLYPGQNLAARIVAYLLFTGFILWQTHREHLLGDIAALFPRLKRKAASRPKIVCFAGARYDLPSWTNRQHIMSRLSATYPVLYVEPRHFLPRQLWQLRRNPARLLTYLKQLVWCHTQTDTLIILSQANLIPGSRRYQLISWINHQLNRWWVLLRARWLGFRTPPSILWIYDTEAAQYLPDFSQSRVVYDCVDDHAVQAGLDSNPSLVQQEEQRIFQHADLVTVTSQRLLDLKKDQHTNIHLVPNAGDVASFSRQPTAPPREIGSLPKPILGSVGALDAYKFDFDILLKTAHHNPDWTFVFIGAPVVDHTTKQLKELMALPNVHVFGARDRHQVPAYVYQFDVCLIPYKANDYNKASFPLKFWEFMATGKPVVVTGLPELKPYENLIYYAENSDELQLAMQHALAESDPAKAEQRKQLAQQHSWEIRVEQLRKLIGDIMKK